MKRKHTEEELQSLERLKNDQAHTDLINFEVSDMDTWDMPEDLKAELPVNKEDWNTDLDKWDVKPTEGRIQLLPGEWKLKDEDKEQKD